MLDDIRIFIYTAKHQSLSAAASFLEMPTATLTRRLQKLEEKVGNKLINRNARHFSLTQEGIAYYQAYQAKILDLEDITRSLKDESTQLAGELHVLAPSNISTGLLHPMWAAFVKAHPSIRLKLTVSNQVENIFAKQIDIALRIGPQADSALHHQRLGQVDTILIASPEYLTNHGEPVITDDLTKHQSIVSTATQSWILNNTEKNRSVEVFPTAKVEVNDIQIIRKFVLEGLGVALLPKSEIVEDLEDGQLVQILSEWEGPKRDIYAVWPSGQLLNAKAKCLKDFMRDYINSIPILQSALIR